MATSFVLTGDKYRAIRYKWQAENMLDHLEWSVNFLNKKQLASRREFANGVVITCNYVYGQRMGRIFYPPQVEISKQQKNIIDVPQYPFVFVIEKDSTLYNVRLAFNNDGRVLSHILEINGVPRDSKSYDTFNFRGKRCVISGDEIYTTQLVTAIQELNTAIYYESISNNSYKDFQYTQIQNETTLRCLWLKTNNLIMKEFVLEEDAEGVVTIELTDEKEYSYNHTFDESSGGDIADHANRKHHPLLGYWIEFTGVMPSPSVYLNYGIFTEVTFETCTVWKSSYITIGFSCDTVWSKHTINLDTESSEELEFFPFVTSYHNEATDVDSTVNQKVFGGAGSLSKDKFICDYDLTTDKTIDTYITYNEYECHNDNGNDYVGLCSETHRGIDTKVRQNITADLFIEDVQLFSEYDYKYEFNLGEAVFYRVQQYMVVEEDESSYEYEYGRGDQGSYMPRLYPGNVWNIKQLSMIDVQEHYTGLTQESPGVGVDIDDWGGCDYSPDTPDVHNVYDIIRIENTSIVYNFDVDDEIPVVGGRNLKAISTEFNDNCITIFDPVTPTQKIVNGDIDTFYRLDNRFFQDNNWDNGILLLCKEIDGTEYKIIYNGVDCTTPVIASLESLDFDLNNLTQAYMV